MPWLHASTRHQQPWHCLDSMRDQQMIVFYVEWFEPPAPSHCWEMIENAHIDDLVQDCSISIANALEILHSLNHRYIAMFPTIHSALQRLRPVWDDVAMLLQALAVMQVLYFIYILQWRHDERDVVSTHQSHGCLLNRLIRRRKHQSSASLAFVMGIHRWPVNSPHIGPVTLKWFHLMTSSWYSFQVKTLILYGENDRRVGPSAIAKLQHVPDSREYKIANAGHACYMNQPEEWHKALYNFLNVVESE